MIWFWVSLKWTEKQRARTRDREGVARSENAFLVWKAFGNGRINVSFLTCLATPCVLFIIWQQTEVFWTVFRQKYRVVFVHQEENCAQCVTWSSSSGSQETCAAIFHTRMAGISPNPNVFKCLMSFILYYVRLYQNNKLYGTFIQGQILLIAILCLIFFSLNVCWWRRVQIHILWNHTRIKRKRKKRNHMQRCYAYMQIKWWMYIYFLTMHK